MTRRVVVGNAEGVGSRFRAKRLPCGWSLPENDSRPLLQDAIRIRLSVPRCRAGFSLMEVLLAISILLACLLVLGQMATVGRQHAEDAESLTVAQLLCQAKLNEILIGAQPMASQSATPIPEMPGWAYEVEVQSLDQYDLSAIRVTVAPEETDERDRTPGQTFLFAPLDACAAVRRSDVFLPVFRARHPLPAVLRCANLGDRQRDGWTSDEPRITLFRDFLRKRRAAAFTLLEMIVATALCGVLLMGLWTLYSTYANLFDRGQARVERSQLCRALMQQIADDLQSAIQDPIPGTPERAWGDAQRRRFGLAGTSSELRMDVLQITPRQGSRLPVGDAVGQSTDQPSARVPELRTVYYTFSSAVDSLDSETVAAPAGLLRRELDFETPASDWDAQSADSDAASSVGVDAEFGARPTNNLRSVPKTRASPSCGRRPLDLGARSGLGPVSLLRRHRLVQQLEQPSTQFAARGCRSADRSGRPPNLRSGGSYDRYTPAAPEALRRRTGRIARRFGGGYSSADDRRFAMVGRVPEAARRRYVRSAADRADCCTPHRAAPLVVPKPSPSGSRTG
jgi:Tfp pilus assembly protein PilV